MLLAVLLTARVDQPEVVACVEELQWHGVVRRVVVDEGTEPAIWAAAHRWDHEQRIQ